MPRQGDKAIIHWDGYKGNKAIFPVCMRSPSVRGRSLTAQLDTASQKIDHMVICMCDTLDRHNMIGIDNASEACIELANTWLDGQFKEFTKRFKTVEVLRWEADIRAHKDFNWKLEAVKKMASHSSRYVELRESGVNYYIESKIRKAETDKKRGLNAGFDVEAMKHSAREYLEEEFAGDMIYHQLTGGIPNIYWGLYFDDYEFFQRESGNPKLAFPKTLGVDLKRHGPSLKASNLIRFGKSLPKPQVA